MSETPYGEPLAAILDALTLVQAQLEEIGARAKRLEANQVEIMGRLDAIDTAQAGVPDLQPILENILAEIAAGRTGTASGLARVAQLAGWAHAAARGNRAELPADIVDDPLLELFILSQPADQTPTRRALVDWRRVSHGLDSGRLIELLRLQYLPSPTDTPPDRRLRFQLAAITREELEGRGVVPPRPPATSYPADRDDAARAARSAELARQWREGDDASRYAEPELAGPMDILAAAQREGTGMSEAELAAGLSDLRRMIAERLDAGDRPELARPPSAAEKLVGPQVREDRAR